MYGILRNGNMLLSKGENKERVRIDSYGNLIVPDKSIWIEIDNCSNPYMDEFRWNVNSRINNLKRIYIDDDLELIQFSEERLQQFIVNRLKGI